MSNTAPYDEPYPDEPNDPDVPAEDVPVEPVTPVEPGTVRNPRDV